MKNIRTKLERETLRLASEFSEFELAVLGALMDNGANLDYYTEEQLHCFPAFIKAEACTQYLDLRPKNEKMKNNVYVPQQLDDLAENEVPGTVLVQRTNTNGNSSKILDYKPKADFDTLVENGNKDAINYFTINDEGNLIIAKWDHVKITVNGDYPEHLDDSEKDEPKDEDIITTEEIVYSQYIKKYTMPFEFLVQLLVTTEAPDFCKEVVDCVLGSKIVINIQEEETITVSDETKIYTVHSKDEKYVDYEIKADTASIKSENGYFLEYAEDDEGNVCTNYPSPEKLTVKVHTEYTSHSYAFEISEADTWIAHYTKEYKDNGSQVENNQANTESKGKYKKIESEVEQPITDQNTISRDKDVIRFTAEKENYYKPRVEAVTPKVSISTYTDDSGENYKVININGNIGGTNLSTYAYVEQKDEDGNGTGIYNLPQTFYVQTNPESPESEDDIYIPGLYYTFTINSDKTEYTTPAKNTTCTVSSLNIKNFEKIDLETNTVTEITKYPADPNPKTATHIYATESGEPGRGYGDKNTKYEKFLAAYNNSEKAINCMNDINSWLFKMMEERESTVELVDTVKYLLYMYDGKDRGVTELEGFEDIFNPSNFTPINNGSGTGWWWPIGSIETETIDGKLFAKGEPALGKSNISRAGGLSTSKYTVGNGHVKSTGTAVDIHGNGQTNKWNVISIGNGTVTRTADGNSDSSPSANYGMGNYVIIDYGNGLEGHYYHLYNGSIIVKPGDKVEYGQVIGKMGNSGNSTGVHLHIIIKKNGVNLDTTEYIDPDNPRPTSGIDSPAFTFPGRSPEFYNLNDEWLKTFTAVVIAEGGTDADSVFWTASAMFNRIDIKYYGDYDATKILTRGWSGAYNDGCHNQYLTSTYVNSDEYKKVYGILLEVINGKRAHKYTDFGCNVPGNEVANNWIKNNPGKKYEWFKGNMYCAWNDSIK